ncbi:MAG: hypothetical protein KC620_01635 [Myxococcales bacterium]|nr:hypothetical protein [Myxococcales bacterium]
MRRYIWAILLAWAPIPAFAAVQSHPVPIKIEGELRPAGVFLRFDVQAIGQPFDAFAAAAPADPADEAFIRLLRALRNRDAGALTPLLVRRNLNGAPAEVIETWHQAFGGFTNVQVIGRARIGQRTLIYWETQTAKGPWLRAFAFEGSPGALKAELTTSNAPIETLTLHALSAERRDPTHFRATATTQGQYSVNLTAGVALEFDAVPTDFEATAQTPPADPALLAYGQAVAWLAAGDVERYAAALPETSRGKLALWRRSKPEEFENWRRFSTTSRRVLLRVGDDRVAAIFFAEGPPEDSPQRLVRWEWMARDGDRWRPVNFFRVDYLDDIFEKGALPREERDLPAAVAAMKRQ